MATVRERILSAGFATLRAFIAGAGTGAGETIIIGDTDVIIEQEENVLILQESEQTLIIEQQDTDIIVEEVEQDGIN